jgi:hypothetical protein
VRTAVLGFVQDVFSQRSNLRKAAIVHQLIHVDEQPQRERVGRSVGGGRLGEGESDGGAADRVLTARVAGVDVQVDLQPAPRRCVTRCPVNDRTERPDDGQRAPGGSGRFFDSLLCTDGVRIQSSEREPDPIVLHQRGGETADPRRRSSHRTNGLSQRPATPEVAGVGRDHVSIEVRNEGGGELGGEPVAEGAEDRSPLWRCVLAEAARPAIGSVSRRTGCGRQDPTESAAGEGAGPAAQAKPGRTRRRRARQPRVRATAA